IRVEREVGGAKLAGRGGYLELLFTEALVPDHEGIRAGRQSADFESSRLITHRKERMVHHRNVSSFPRMLIVFEWNQHFRARKSLYHGLSIRRMRLIPLLIVFWSGMNVVNRLIAVNDLQVLTHTHA